MSKFTVTISFLPSQHSFQYQVLAANIVECFGTVQEKTSDFRKEKMAEGLEVFGVEVCVQSTPGPVVL